MTISKEKREKVVLTKVANGGTFEADGKNKFWVVCTSYALLLAVTIVTVLVLNSPAGQTTGLVSRWRASSSQGSRPKNWHNILVEESSNYTSTLMSLLLTNATMDSKCGAAATNYTKFKGLPNEVDGKILFETDRLYYLTLVAYSENGERRCAGGDYFEVDFHDRQNLHYRSRLPTTDLGNGSYVLELVVPSRFAGAFTIDVFLLFGNWHGLEFNTPPWGNKGLVLTQELQMVVRENHRHHKIKPDHQRPMLKQCTPADFDRTTWQGRWTRSWYNRDCVPDQMTKRFQCLPEEHYWCEEPWCFGPVGRLEGNGWQYSAHCSFKIFERDEAWKCLDGRWFMMWGDSNFQDTIRNLLLFILDWQLPNSNLADFQLSRTYEMAFTASFGYDKLFRVSQLFNGAKHEHGNGEGMNTLRHQEHQDLLLAHFNGSKWPDTIIMNSGLHDGVAIPTIELYSQVADYTIDFWLKLYKSLPADRKPQMIWRATVAPAGVSRSMPANPNKMEMFNLVMAEKLQAVRDQMPVMFVDAFDLTFPFHYNNEFSDGGHYGRAPGVDLWPWFRNPHWYFVDVMLAHIFLNALCPAA